MSNVPSDLKYAKSHEWVRVSGDTAVVGITDHAQHELTDVVFVELPEVGRQVKAGEACAVVESVKTASDIYSPVSGEIVAVNKPVVDNPALVNTEPYAGGWFYKIKLSNVAELGSLLTPETYQAQIGADRVAARGQRPGWRESWPPFSANPLSPIADNQPPMHVRLFIKPWCGWCHKAMQWLDARGIEYEKIDVMASDAAWDEMVRLSDQDLAPVIEVDGQVLADFGPEELAAFWHKLEEKA